MNDVFYKPMKFVLIGLLCIGTLAVAQPSGKNRLETRISDDGKKLSIQIDGMRHGKVIHFDETFDVSHKNALQKEILKYQVFASVGAPFPTSGLFKLLGLAFVLITLVITVLIVRFQWRRRPSLAA